MAPTMHNNCNIETLTVSIETSISTTIRGIIYFLVQPGCYTILKLLALETSRISFHSCISLKVGK